MHKIRTDDPLLSFQLLMVKHFKSPKLSDHSPDGFFSFFFCKYASRSWFNRSFLFETVGFLPSWYFAAATLLLLSN